LLHNTRAGVLALTRGANGAALLTRHGQEIHGRETQSVQVLDTVGAGDCFLAGLVVAMLEHGLPAGRGGAQMATEVVQDLLGKAICSASLCVMQRGCVPPLRAQVQTRLRQVPMDFSV